jgi:hypothetical protein
LRKEEEEAHHSLTIDQVKESLCDRDELGVKKE